MNVSNWMTKKVFTVAPGDPLTDAVHLMREQGIKHIPVVSGGKLKGIVSDRDIREFTPSKATTLDIYELHYLLARTRVKEIMEKKVITIAPDAPVESAALLMLDRSVGCLPVVEGGTLAGIISDRDIFRVLVDLTGIRHGGNRITIVLADVSGSIKTAADIIRKHGFGLQSILTSYVGVQKGSRRVVFRTTGTGNIRALAGELTSTFRTVEIKKG